MSADFLFGLAALPIAAALIAAFLYSLYGIFFLVWKNRYTLGPKRLPDGIYGKVRIIHAVADMGHVYRIFYFYGWTMLIGRQPKGERRPLRPAFEDQERDPFLVAMEKHLEEVRRG